MTWNALHHTVHFVTHQLSFSFLNRRINIAFAKSGNRGKREMGDCCGCYASAKHPVRCGLHAPHHPRRMEINSFIWDNLSWDNVTFTSLILPLNCTTDRKASPEGNLYSRCLSSLPVERVMETSVPVVSWCLGKEGFIEILWCCEEQQTFQKKKMHLDISSKRGKDIFRGHRRIFGCFHFCRWGKQQSIQMLVFSFSYLLYFHNFLF